ncbi:hypothetical protein B0H14DRAFT_2810524 [Mycena olivaceomarginata]|nr:hypothetical protein B0H14DRAFT_2810524 [Mycena olivaceomarginata]
MLCRSITRLGVLFHGNLNSAMILSELAYRPGRLSAARPLNLRNDRFYLRRLCLMPTVVRPPVSVPGVLDSFTETWSQRLIASINSEYEMSNEVFYVLSGTLTIELQGVDLDKVVLNKGDTFVVPRGVQHRPVVEEGIAEVLIVEKAGVINTGGRSCVQSICAKGVADARA